MAQSSKISHGGASLLSGMITIHDDNAAYKVSVSILTMEMEAATDTPSVCPES